jgi:hypothetical protein
VSITFGLPVMQQPAGVVRSASIRGPTPEHLKGITSRSDLAKRNLLAKSPLTVHKGNKG